MKKLTLATITAFLGLMICTQLVNAQDAKKKSTKPKAIVPEVVKLGRPVDFQRDIYPILENNCVACHNVAIDESKFVAEDVASILKGGKRGPAVIPKQPEKSLLYLLAARGKGPAMPPLPNKVDAKGLTPRELGLLKQWILEGATTGMTSKEAKVNWAPLPVGLNPIYSVALSPWGRFVAAGRSNKVAIFDLVTGTELTQLIDPALVPLKYNNKPMYPGGSAHRDFVHSLAFSPSGDILASGGYRTVKLWQREKNAKSFQLNAGNLVTSSAVNADATLAAFGMADNSIQLVNLATGKVQKKLAGHAGAVMGLQFTPDGQKLVSGSKDKTILVWNLKSGNSERKITSSAAINAIALNKDATQIISAEADNALRVWTVAKPAPAKPAKTKVKAKPKAKQPAGEKPVLELKGHSKPVTSVALILPAGTQIVSGSEDGTVRTWTLSNGRVARTMNHGSPVTAVAARADGLFLASAAVNNTARLWTASNGRQVAEMKGSLALQQQIARLMESQAVAKQLATSTAATVKTADKNVKDREAAAKKATVAVTAADKALATAKTKAKPGNDKLAAAKAALAKKPKDNTLKRNVTTAQKAADKLNGDLKKATNTQSAAKRTQQLSEKSVKTAKEKLVQANKDKAAADTHQKAVDAQLKIAQTGSKTAEKPIRTLAFSADGTRLATAGDDNIVHLWSAEDGRHLDELSGHKSAISTLAFGKNDVLITGSTDKTAISWNLKSTWKLLGRLGVSKEAPLDLSKSPFVNRILSLSFSPDGRYLATGGGDPSRSGELMIWDVSKQSLVREIKDAHSDTILGVEFSRDGKQILSGAADKFAKVFDVATGKKIRSFEGHTHHVLDVSWQADGSTIATAGADNVIKVWNVSTGEQKRSIAGYSKQVTSVQFIGVGSNIVSCGGDKTVRLNRTSNGQTYRTFAGGTDYMYASAAARDAGAVIKSVTSEATIVVAGGEDGVLRVWNGTAKLLKAFEPPKPPVTNKTQVSK
jgi:WD40 repeat protein